MSPEELAQIAARTIDYYERNALGFREGTKDHDVSQNLDALLARIEGVAPFRILDFGCGPGRDLLELAARGHIPTGLDGAQTFVSMAREASGCEVLHQSFLELDLPSEAFDGVFANATLFHVPTQELDRVLGELWATLRAGGVLFCSNPRGDNREGFSGERYSAFTNLETWRRFLARAGFDELDCYYRPPGRPRAEQPWLATVWRKR